MRLLLLVVLAASAFSAAAQTLNKCTDAAGKIVYQETPCAANARSSQKVKIDTPATPANQDGSPKVSDAVVAQCFQGFRMGSKDPTAMKLIAYYARFHIEGYPMAVLDVVMPPVRGTSERRELWCRLKGDMTVNEIAMKDTWWDFRMKEQYDFEKRR